MEFHQVHGSSVKRSSQLDIFYIYRLTGRYKDSVPNKCTPLRSTILSIVDSLKGIDLTGVIFRG